MAIRPSRLILAALAVVAVASLWRAVVVEREKQAIAKAYAEAHELAQQLGAERAQLSEQLEQTQGQLEAETAAREELNQHLASVQEKLDATTGQLSSLQQQFAQLEETNSGLTTQLGAVTTEKQELEARLSSLKELKLAIREVKQKMHWDRLEARRLRIVAFEELDQEALTTGNRGFVVRHGTPTIGAASKLRVHVLQPEAQ